MCWEARNLTLIVNMFWAIMCDWFFCVCCAIILRVNVILWYLGSRVMEIILWGLMLFHVIFHFCHGPWTVSHQRASWNYQPSISPSLRLPFIYQEHVDTHEFTFFLRLPSLPNRSNRTSTGLGQRLAFNSIKSRSLWALKITELQRVDVKFF